MQTKQINKQLRILNPNILTTSCRRSLILQSITSARYNTYKIWNIKDLPSGYKVIGTKKVPLYHDFYCKTFLEFLEFPCKFFRWTLIFSFAVWHVKICATIFLTVCIMYVTDLQAGIIIIIGLQCIQRLEPRHCASEGYYRIQIALS